MSEENFILSSHDVISHVFTTSRTYVCTYVCIYVHVCIGLSFPHFTIGSKQSKAIEVANKLQ